MPMLQIDGVEVAEISQETATDLLQLSSSGLGWEEHAQFPTTGRAHSSKAVPAATLRKLAFLFKLAV